VAFLFGAPAPLLLHNAGAAFKTAWARDAYRAEAQEENLVVKDAAAADSELAAWLAAERGSRIESK
jgi:hypothetical protein